MGEPPRLDLAAHAAVAGLVRDLVTSGRVAGVHDAADGLGVAVAEMAVRSGTGCAIHAPRADHAWLFAESASRVVVCVLEDELDAVLAEASAAGVTVSELGRAGGDRLRVDGLLDLALADAVLAWKAFLPDAIGAGATH